MRILVFNWRSFLSRGAGGAETHCYEIFNRLAEGGHFVRLVASCDDATKPKETFFGKVKIFHVCKSEFFYPFFSIFCLSNFPFNSYDVIVEDVSKFPLFWPLVISKVLGKPFVIIVHHVHGKTLFEELPFPLNALSFFIEFFGLKFYSLFNLRVVTVSESTKRELVSLGFRVENVSVIPNGLNFSPVKFSVKKKSVFPIVVYFGRVKRYKRIDHLIQAVKIASAKIGKLKLIVAGKGDAEVYMELRSLAHQLGLEVVEFYGEVDEKVRDELFQKAWVYAIASMKEGFGISVLEAQSFGLPVVAYAVPGILDSVVHMKSGILVRDGDVQAFAEALTRICSDEALREKLSKGAIENAEKYDWNKSANDFLEMLETCFPRNND
jgi:glycosyltransferase involved in cell wall biosynthesis